MYFKSSEISRENGKSLRPEICASPESPGFAFKIFFSCAENFSISVGKCGRGPTNDISPRKILKICGTSSSENRRKNLPKRVIRGSFLILKSGPSRCDFFCKFFFKFSAFATIDRNLKILKMRPSRPTRFCAKKTDPRESNLIKIGKIKNSGAVKIVKIVAKKRSTPRFKMRFSRRKIGKFSEIFSQKILTQNFTVRKLLRQKKPRFFTAVFKF